MLEAVLDYRVWDERYRSNYYEMDRRIQGHPVLSPKLWPSKGRMDDGSEYHFSNYDSYCREYSSDLYCMLISTSRALGQLIRGRGERLHTL